MDKSVNNTNGYKN